MAKELVYEWNTHKLFFDGQHYIMDSKEDIDALIAHLREIMRANLNFTDAYKNAKWLFCDLYIKGIGVEIPDEG